MVNYGLVCGVTNCIITLGYRVRLGSGDKDFKSQFTAGMLTHSILPDTRVVKVQKGIGPDFI